MCRNRALFECFRPSLPGRVLHRLHLVARGRGWQRIGGNQAEKCIRLRVRMICALSDV